MEQIPNIVEDAVALVKSAIDAACAKAGKSYDGTWHAVSDKGYLVVFHLKPSEEEKIDLYRANGLNPLEYLACAWNDTVNPVRMRNMVHDCLFIVSPDDEEAINEEKEYRFTAAEQQASIIITMAFVLGLQEHVTWADIKPKLLRLIATISLNKRGSVDYKEAVLQLEALIKSNANEHSFRDFIKDFKAVLLPYPYDYEDWRDVDVKTEQSMTVGKSDLILYARPCSVRRRTKAFVWELKASRQKVFEINKKSERATPTNTLLYAENQLLHYFCDLSMNGLLQRKNRIYTEDVKLGGIVIGSDEQYVACRNKKLNIKDASSSADLARDVRERLFYEPNNMQLLTWDDVLRRLKNRMQAQV